MDMTTYETVTERRLEKQLAYKPCQTWHLLLSVVIGEGGFPSVQWVLFLSKYCEITKLAIFLQSSMYHHQ